jgi:hypothetical protein
MRTLTSFFVLLICGCIDDSRCNPLLAFRSSAAHDPARNEAEWVFDYSVGEGPSIGMNNSLMTEGLPAMREFTFVDTAQCSERALRVEGPAGASVSRIPKLVRADEAGPPLEVVDVRMDWIPSEAGKVAVTLGKVGTLELEVARDFTSLKPTVVLPKTCTFVARFGEGFVCDSWVYESDGGSTSMGDFRVFDVQGSAMLATSGDAGAWAYLRRNEQSGAFDVEILDSTLSTESIRPVLFEQTIYFAMDGGLAAFQTATRITTQMPGVSRLRTLTRGALGLIWLEGEPNGTGSQICTHKAGSGSFCEALEGRVLPVGTDRGIWAETEINRERKLALWDFDGEMFRQSTGPLVRSRGYGNAPLGLAPPFWQAYRPGVLSTRSICAFRETDKTHIGVAVLPEGDIHSHKTISLHALGGGREGLRWCSDLILTKTFVYDLEM